MSWLFPCTRSSLLRPWIERVLHGIANEVEGEHGQERRQAREEHVPPSLREDGGGIGDQLAPASGWRLNADAEERERGLVEDHLRDEDRGVDDDRCDQVRQQLLEDDPRVRGPNRAGRL